MDAAGPSILSFPAGWLAGYLDAADTVFTCGPVFRVFRLAGGWWLAGYLVVSFYIGWGLVGDLAGWPVAGWQVTWLCHFILDGD